MIRDANLTHRARLPFLTGTDSIKSSWPMSSKRHQQASIPPSLLSSSFWSNVFLSTAHRITFRTASYLPTAVNNNNTYKYRAMSSSSAYSSTDILASDIF
ncbi:Protein of unknown function [Pyronema omphalodes CBS 100304]|uniref:Uncharacterized protein n=1 Tax=Pyronema omphalodes (strain CBS 100304) TaxID=1076935 RepID=U4LRY2_PYROM|nr:Protein of unknown function [Pyronema omphalodes CBS 100304]